MVHKKRLIYCFFRTNNESALNLCQSSKINIMRSAARFFIRVKDFPIKTYSYLCSLYQIV